MNRTVNLICFYVIISTSLSIFIGCSSTPSNTQNIIEASERQQREAEQRQQAHEAMLRQRGITEEQWQVEQAESRRREAQARREQEALSQLIQNLLDVGVNVGQPFRNGDIVAIPQGLFRIIDVSNIGNIYSYLVIMNDSTPTIPFYIETSTQFRSGIGPMRIEYLGTAQYMHGRATRNTLRFREASDIETNENNILFPSNYFEYERVASGISITGYNGSLRNIIIPSTIDGINVTEIGRNAFAKKPIESVILPNTLLIIGYGAFNECRITNLVIPDSVTLIDDWAFARNNISSLRLSSRINRIGNAAFLVNRLTEIVIPDSCKIIAGSAFGANRLTIIVLPNSVEEVGMGAFGGNQITSFTLSSNMRMLQHEVFQNNQIEHIVIPPTITTLWGRPFINNPVRTITLGSNINIGSNDFLPHNFTAYYNQNDKRAGVYTLSDNSWQFINE